LALAFAHRLAQRLEEVVDSHDAHALELQPVPQQPVERLLHVVGVRQVLGELLEDLLSGQADALRPIPFRIANQVHGADSQRRHRDTEIAMPSSDLSVSLCLCGENLQDR
jgi:hypothetical protein